MDEAYARAQDLGALIASATNLALSVELYLKALLITLGLPVPRTHDLVDLYTRIPGDLKSSLEARYKARPAPAKVYASALQVALSVGPATDQELDRLGDQPQSDLENNSLPSVLGRCRDAFQSWRYIHEGGVPGSVALYNYEFHYLHGVAETLRDQLMRKIVGDHGVKRP